MRSSSPPSSRAGAEMSAARRDLGLLLDWLARCPWPRAYLGLLAGLLLGWWLYVPVHELLHVAGCLVAGAEVSRLELSPLYLAVPLSKLFDFVAVGSDYAGQLTGFDTHGSDLAYLACVLAPYSITIFPAFYLWQRLLEREATPGLTAAAAGGALLVPVSAPILSLTGDYYEAGSILGSRLLAGPLDQPLERWRHDDLFLLISELDSPGWADGLGIAFSLLVAVLLAVATLLAGSVLGRFIHRIRGKSA